MRGSGRASTDSPDRAGQDDSRQATSAPPACPATILGSAKRVWPLMQPPGSGCKRAAMANPEQLLCQVKSHDRSIATSEQRTLSVSATARVSLSRATPVGFVPRSRETDAPLQSPCIRSLILRTCGLTPSLAGSRQLSSRCKPATLFRAPDVRQSGLVWPALILAMDVLVFYWLAGNLFDISSSTLACAQTCRHQHTTSRLWSSGAHRTQSLEASTSPAQLSDPRQPGAARRYR